MNHAIDSRTLLADAIRLALLGCCIGISGAARLSAAAEPGSKRIPVIFDTDIGDDIDDTWALALLLKCPELDVKLVVGDQGKSDYRARLIAKLLAAAGRTEIPIGIGLDAGREGTGPQRNWITDYNLTSYPGKVHADGVGAIIDTIMNSPEPITLIAAGPLPNIKAALERQPEIAEKARFVGMHGSIRRGYGGSKQVAAEYNVRADPAAGQKVFTAPWEMTITPLDTCGLVSLRGPKYAAVRDCRVGLTVALIENYRLWWKNNPGSKDDPTRAETTSSTLFDTVAVYLAMSRELCTIETLPIRVTDEGKTVIDPNGKKMAVATAWKDLGRFEDVLVERLTGGP